VACIGYQQRGRIGNYERNKPKRRHYSYRGKLVVYHAAENIATLTAAFFQDIPLDARTEYSRDYHAVKCRDCSRTEKSIDVDMAGLFFQDDLHLDRPNPEKDDGEHPNGDQKRPPCRRNRLPELSEVDLAEYPDK